VNGVGANVVYQWQVNGLNVGSNSATFSLANTIEDPIKVTDVIQCTITDKDDGLSAISNKLTKITVVQPVKLFFQIFAQTTLPVCSGTEVDFGTTYSNLNENHVNNLTGVWRVNGVVVHSGLTLVTTSLNDGDVVTCTATYYMKCGPPIEIESNSVKVSIISSSGPSISVTPVNATGCVDAPLSFKATLANAGVYNNYQWLINGNKTGANSDTFSSSTLQTGDKVTCQVTASADCGIYKIESAPAVVTIVPQSGNSVTITSDAVNNFIVAGQNVRFTADASYVGNKSYQWAVNGVNAGTNSSIFEDSNLTIGDVVTCKVTSTDACVVPVTATSNAIMILMHVPLQIPNVFTPNDDGKNDQWVITALLIYPTCTVNVFDRYGSQVFYSTGYTSAWTGSQNGKRAPNGVYYYVINLNNGTSPLSGYVTIVR